MIGLASIARSGWSAPVVGSPLREVSSLVYPISISLSTVWPFLNCTLNRFMIAAEGTSKFHFPDFDPSFDGMPIFKLHFGSVFDRFRGNFQI